MDDHRFVPPPIPSENLLNLNKMNSPNINFNLRAKSSHFKTRMCMRFQLGLCPNGFSCNFAHCIEELRRPNHNGSLQTAFMRNQEYFNSNVLNGYVRGMNQNGEKKLNKKKICKFFGRGICPYGDKCSFVHVKDSEDLNVSCSRRRNFVRWKTKLCHRWLTYGKCFYGDECNHAHGDAELRKHCEADLQSVGVDCGRPKLVNVPKLADDLFAKVKEHISEAEQSPRITTLTLKKCKRIYGDWIDG